MTFGLRRLDVDARRETQQVRIVAAPALVEDHEGIARKRDGRAVRHVEAAPLGRILVVEAFRKRRVEGFALAFGLRVGEGGFDAQRREDRPADAERVDETARTASDVTAQVLFVKRSGGVERQVVIQRSVGIVGAVVRVEPNIVREAPVRHVVRGVAAQRSDVLEKEPVHVAVGKVDAQRRHLLVRLLHDTRRGVAAARNVVAEILAAARKHQVVDVVESRAQGHPLPVGVDSGIGPCEPLVILLLPFDIAAAAPREIAVDARLPFVFELLVRIEQAVVRQIGNADLEVPSIADLQPPGLRRARGDDHHPVGGFRAVERSRRGIFQHRDRLDVVRRHIENIGDVHLRPVEDEKRDIGPVALDETAAAAQHHIRDLVGVGAVGDVVENFESRRAQLNDVQHVGVHQSFDLLPAYDVRGARVALLFLVHIAGDHDIGDVLGTLRQANVVGALSGDDLHHPLAVAQHADTELRSPGRTVEDEAARGVGHRAVRLAPGVVGDDVGSDHGPPLLVGHRTAEPHRGSALLSRDTARNRQHAQQNTNTFIDMRHIGITRKDNGAKIEQETAHSYRYDSVFRKCNIPTNGECAKRRKSLILRLQNQTLCTGQKRLSARRRCFPPAPRSNSGRHPTAWSRPFRNSKRPPYTPQIPGGRGARSRRRNPQRHPHRTCEIRPGCRRPRCHSHAARIPACGTLRGAHAP